MAPAAEGWDGSLGLIWHEEEIGGEEANSPVVVVGAGEDQGEGPSWMADWSLPDALIICPSA